MKLIIRKVHDTSQPVDCSEFEAMCESLVAAVEQPQTESDPDDAYVDLLRFMSRRLSSSA